MGGIKGIANNRKALDEYFLTVSEMGNIIQDFCDVFKMKHQKEPSITNKLDPKTRESMVM